MWTMGGFSNRYGNAGPRQQSSGYYQTQLFGRTHVLGEALTADIQLGDELKPDRRARDRSKDGGHPLPRPGSNPTSTPRALVTGAGARATRLDLRAPRARGVDLGEFGDDRGALPSVLVTQ